MFTLRTSASLLPADYLYVLCGILSLVGSGVLSQGSFRTHFNLIQAGDVIKETIVYVLE